ncbi:MAG TPA: aminotransferase class V-fold PLP-dependent enzyme [Steroidobacter sp.]|jgi:selenocysteine lyase/cysteine desulfurase|nr:aminotransferase class V-fold PLP-dependent enzyme [Steroidobacter sp.]
MTESTALSRRELIAGALALGALGVGQTGRAQGLLNIPTSSRELWRWVRTQPVLDSQVAYLDAASAGPTLRAAMAAEYRARDAQSFSIAAFTSDQWLSETNRIAARVAAFVGCEADEVQITSGAGEAVGLVAAGLDLAPGDEIITTTREHPAAISPWLVLARRRGVSIKQIELPTPLSGPEQLLGLFAGAIGERTKAFMFSHINYTDGVVMPVRELCDFARQKGVISIIDGAQSLGMIDFAMRDLNCDFYATCFHKWLGGSHGTGMLFVRRDKLDVLWPAAPRGMDASPPMFTPTEDFGHAGAPAALHKLGNLVPHVWPALRGVEAAMELQQQIGRARIEARVRELAVYARLRLQQLQGVELLTPARPGLWAGILAFRSGAKQAAEVVASLARNQRVFVRQLVWPGSDNGAVRLSLHVFNTHDEIDRLIQGLQAVLR